MCFLVFPDDYESVINEGLDFVVGQDRVCHNIGITDDNICEINLNEIFFSNLELDSRGRRIDLDPERAQIIIDDANELECGEVSCRDDAMPGIVIVVCAVPFVYNCLSSLFYSAKDFSSDHYVVLESDGTAELCLVLNVPLSIPALDVIVTTTTTATDTATAGVLYISRLHLPFVLVHAIITMAPAVLKLQV